MSDKWTKVVLGGIIVLAVICFLLFLYGCDKVESTTVQGTVLIEWTAVGDDGILGQAFANDGRYSSDSTYLVQKFDSCSKWPGIDTLRPGLPGTPQSHQFDIMVDLERPYFFAHRTIDNAGNKAALSNIIRLVWADTVAPSQTIITGRKIR